MNHKNITKLRFIIEKLNMYRFSLKKTLKQLF